MLTVWFGRVHKLVKMLTAGSLFSGIGGMDLGLERAGIKILWQSEIDKYCLRVLSRRWPKIPRFGDVSKIVWEDVPYADILAGGFPCQPVSIGGKRRGEEDRRWLWPEFLRAIRDLRPKYVLIENVPGLRSKGFREVLKGLASGGYDAEWQSIPAKAFGLRQLRERVIIVAYANGNISSLRGEREISTQTSAGRRDYRDGCQGVAKRQITVFSARICSSDGGVFSTRDTTSKQLWQSESGVYRVAYGLPNGLDRCRVLGNAMIPQLAEYAGKHIVKHWENMCN